MPRHGHSSSSQRAGWRTAAWPWLLSWGIGLSALIGTCALLHVPRIEREILGNVQRAVAPIVSSPVRVTVDGHTATITGPVADEAERDALLLAVADSDGVRTVIDELTRAAGVTDPINEPAPPLPEEPAVPEPAGAPELAGAPEPAGAPALPAAAGVPADSEAPDGPEQSNATALPERATGPTADEGVSADDAAAPDAPLPSLTMRLDGRALTLEGRMSAADDLAALIQPALAAFDPSYLTNSIDTSKAAAPAGWVTPLAALMPDLAELDDPVVDIAGHQITLGGTATTRDIHDRVIDTALEAFDDYALIERIELSPNAAPSAASGTRDASGPTAPPRPDSSMVTLPAVEPSTVPVETAADADPATALEREFAALDGPPLLFESDSDRLTGGSAPRLDALATLLGKYPGIRVEIEGHTDAAGDAVDNLALSQKRANAVRDALIERGVPRERLIAYGYGEGVPLDDNSTPEGRARNRRIEFRF